MSKVIAPLGLVVLAVVGTATAQQPDFSGRWELVAERSTPRGSTGLLGKWMVIKSAGSVVTIESALGMTRTTTVNGQRVSEQVESSTTAVYTVDGAEHDVERTYPPDTIAGSLSSRAPSQTYRATWTTGQLVIITSAKTVAPSPELPVPPFRVTRMALTLGTDGLLVVDGISISQPQAGAAVQSPPASTRTVYVKKN